jgi:hypothetical protein
LFIVHLSFDIWSLPEEIPIQYPIFIGRFPGNDQSASGTVGRSRNGLRDLLTAPGVSVGEGRTTPFARKARIERGIKCG